MVVVEGTVEVSVETLPSASVVIGIVVISVLVLVSPDIMVVTVVVVVFSVELADVAVVAELGSLTVTLKNVIGALYISGLYTMRIL